MKLASFAESNRAKQLTQLLLKRGRLLGFFLFFVGVVIYLMLPQEQFCRYRFFDEHALLEGLVRREYTDSAHLTHLLTEHSNQGPHTTHIWIRDTLIEYGLEVFTHNFTAASGDSIIIGDNIYGILRAGRSPSTEALVLSAPDLIQDTSPNYGVIILLGLAKYFTTKNYWSKDLIFLVTSEGPIGAQAWIDAYLGVHNKAIKSSFISGRAGSIQAMVNLEVASGNDIHYVNVIAEGVNAILPNLDLVFVGAKLSELEGLNTAFHVLWNSQYSSGSHHRQSLITGAAVLSHQAMGLPLNNHAPFLKHRIDSLTLQVPPSKGRTGGQTLLPLARSLEGIVRSLNNLLERFHHSEFFYITTSPFTFLSIGQYSPFFALLLAPLAIESVRQWLLRNKEISSPSSPSKSYFDKMGIPPLLTISFKPFLLLLLFSLFNGCCLYFLPSLLSFILPLSSIMLTGGMFLFSLLMAFGIMLTRPVFTKEEWHVSCSLTLLLIAISLYSLSLLHFALSLFLTLSLSISLSLSTCNNWRSGIVLFLCLPPLIPVYFCFGYSLLFASSVQSLLPILQDAVTMTTNGLLLAYNSYYLSGAWLYPIGTLYVWPVWILCWVLGWARVQDTQLKLHSD